MRRITRPAVAAALSLAVVLGVAAPATAITEPQVFSVLEVEGPEIEVDPISDDQPPRAGTRIGFTSTLYAWAGTKRGKRVGGLDGMCTFMKIDLVAEAATVFCHAEWRLPGGRILGAGSIRFSESSGPVFRIPVIGGLGAYHNAKGYVVIRSVGGENSGKSVNEFHLTP